MDFASNREVKTVARHFSTYLHPIIANTPELSNESYKIRNEVYCDELHFLDTGKNGLENDDFDQYSTHCLIQHIPTAHYSGTVRVVRPEKNKHTIPLQKYCSDSISKDKINPADFAPHEICEISRLAVPRDSEKDKQIITKEQQQVSLISKFIQKMNYVASLLLLLVYTYVPLRLS